MASKKDVAVTRGVLIEILTNALKEQNVQWKIDLDQRFHDFRLDVRDEIHSCVSGSEGRMTKKMTEIKEEIIDGITEILDESILPQIADLRSDVDRIKTRLQMA